MANTTERLMVGAVVRFKGQVSAHRIIRDDVLDCLYGKRADGARNLIDFALNDFRIASGFGMDNLGSSLGGGFAAGTFHATEPKSVGDALRVAALMYSSLAAIDKLDELDETDAPAPEESNRRFSTEVRQAVVQRRPDLDTYFGRSAVLIDGGEPVRFGFCSARAVMHFGVLHPVRQASGVRDARARLWELSRAREIAGLDRAALIMAAPRLDDPTLSNKQITAARRNLDEIEREADANRMRFFHVTASETGADKVIEYA